MFFSVALSNPYTIHWRSQQFENCFNCFQYFIILVNKVEEINADLVFLDLGSSIRTSDLNFFRMSS